MSAPGLSLAGFQEWMQAVVVHPGGAAKGLASDGARCHVDPARVAEVVLGRGELDAAARLGIYASMYPLRTVAALRSDYPALAGLLGDGTFSRLVADYLAEHPSRSFTLAQLGDALPEFVAGWGARRHRTLRSSVARLERAAARVFDARREAALAPETLAAETALRGDEVRLVPSEAFAVVAAPPGAVAVLDAALEGSAFPTSPGRGHVRVLFHRRDHVVLRRTLPAVPARLLAALASGRSLGEAVDLRARGGRPAPEVVGRWLAEWLDLGLFAGVEPAS